MARIMAHHSRGTKPVVGYEQGKPHGPYILVKYGVDLKLLVWTVRLLSISAKPSNMCTCYHVTSDL
jgi:hypothetical protein